MSDFPPNPNQLPPGYPPSAGGVPPKNWLIESILVTVCCCLPFGIVGIVFASQVSSKFAQGDFAGAQKASEQAKLWVMIGFIVGLIINVIVIGLQVLAVFMAAQNGEFQIIQ